MRRFAAVLILLAAFAARADEPRIPRVAFADASSPVATLNEQSTNAGVKAFFEEMRALGYIEGRNVVVERYSGEGQSENLPALARKVVDSRPDVIVAAPSVVARALKALTDEIPIVTPAPPAGVKFVTDFDHPGGNVTGVVEMPGDLWAMRWALLKELKPSISKIGVLGMRAGSPYEQTMGRPAAAAGVLVVEQLVDAPLDEAKCRQAFQALADEHVDALLVSDAFQFNAQRTLIAQLAATSRIPTIYPYASYVNEGGLASLSLDFQLGFRHLARQVDRILKGSKPGDLAFVKLDTYLLTINQEAAKHIGITVPESVRSRAVMR